MYLKYKEKEGVNSRAIMKVRKRAPKECYQHLMIGILH
jgi:hypothetical protein